MRGNSRMLLHASSRSRHDIEFAIVQLRLRREHHPAAGIKPVGNRDEFIRLRLSRYRQLTPPRRSRHEPTARQQRREAQFTGEALIKFPGRDARCCLTPNSHCGALRQINCLV